jgi:ABC-type polysaccharide/polyol phosphate export permease
VEWALAETIAVAVLVGLVPAAIARRKGRDFLAWWFFGALMFVFALPAALLLRPIGLGRPVPKP